MKLENGVDIDVFENADEDFKACLGRQMCKDLQRYVVKGAFTKLVDQLMDVLPGSYETIQALTMIRNAEKVCEIAIEQDVQDGF